MTPLNLKLWRDLWHIKGQVLAIALIISCGCGVLVMSLSVHQALGDTANAYYERNRFADVFAHLRRAPIGIVDQVRDIDGVRTVEDRVVGDIMLQMPGVIEPVQARLVSLPDYGDAVLNQPLIRSGRAPTYGRVDEVLVSEPFADANELVIGDQFDGVMNGRKRRLTVVGTALSPEFIYIMAAGALLPDDERYGVMWMRRGAVATVFDMDGAFNDISLGLLPGANVTEIIARLDALLARYGGTGAIARKDQLSNWFVMNEIEEAKIFATIFPTVFLAVAAFMTNMLLMRLIAIERSEIGLLKANGYGNGTIAWHYVKLACVIAAFGILLGIVLGYYLGRLSALRYAENFRFPLLLFGLEAWVVIAAAAISFVATVSGAVNAALRVARLPPAEAMRPPQPPVYRRSVLANWRAYRAIDQATRIVLRQIARSPIRSAITTLGIGAGIGVMIMAMQWVDALDELIHVQYFEVQRFEASLSLREPRALGALRDIEHLPAVRRAEPARGAAADFRFGARTHRGSLTSVAPDAALAPLHDLQRGALPIATGGVTLGRELADKLGVRVGDTVEISVLSGRRPQATLPVMDIVETYLGMPAYMALPDLNRLLGDAPSFEYAWLQIERSRMDEFYRALQTVPWIAGTTDRDRAMSTFSDTIEETIYIYITIYSGFALLLAFGVSYNSGRIALSEHGRDLATLRVLGFTRYETGYISFAETALLALAAIPVGYALGWALSTTFASAFANELFRLPPVITGAVLGWAAFVAIVATLAALAFVAARVARLDLISVLKTRE